MEKSQSDSNGILMDGQDGRPQVNSYPFMGNRERVGRDALPRADANQLRIGGETVESGSRFSGIVEFLSP